VIAKTLATAVADQPAVIAHGRLRNVVALRSVNEI
jgi:hypothetical protein